MEKAIFIAILVATSMAYSQALAQEEVNDPYIKEISPSTIEIVDVPATVYDDELIKHMPTKHFRFLEDCSEKLSWNCEFEMAKRLVDNKPTSEECCKEILKMGIDCHKGLMNFVFSTYRLKDDVNRFFPRSKQIWNQCVKNTVVPVGVPLAFET